MVLLSAPATLLAETRYVSDQLRIMVRSGQSLGHAVITTLDSGDSVDVLQTNADSGYSQVRLKNGNQGWALSRFLLPQPTARLRLASAGKKLEIAQQKLATLTPIADQQALQLETITQERNQLAQNLALLQEQTADSVALIEKDKALQAEVSRLTQVNQELYQRVEVLANNQRLRWFMYGGGVLALGVLFGLILPRLRIQRKAWNEF